MPAHRPTLAPVLALAALLGLPALAQAQAQDAPRPIDRTGTGGGPVSTVTAPNTTSLGVTKPPGGAGVSTGPSAELLSEREKREKEKNDRIARSICRGC